MRVKIAIAVGLLHSNDSSVSGVPGKPVDKGYCEMGVAGGYFAVNVCRVFQLV